MKNWAKITFLSFVLLVPSLLFADELSSHVTIQDAKKYAIGNNFEISSLHRQVEEAKANVNRTRSSFFPRFGLAGGADGEINGGNNEGVLTAYAYGNYNLFRGFEDTYRLEVAEIEAQKADIKLNGAIFHVGLEVEQQFLLYLFRKITIELKNRALKLNEVQKRAAAQRRASGLASDSDVMEFDLRESLLKSDLASLEQDLEEARVNLKKLLGEEIGGKIEPVGSLEHRHLKGKLMDYLSRIKDTSQTVKESSRDVSRATVESKIWRSRWIPTVDLETQLGYLGLDARPKNGGAAFRSQILAKFDLFAGFENLWDRRAGEAKRLRAESQLKHVVLTAATQIEITFRKIKAIESRVHLEEDNEVRAKRYYDSVLSEYRRGVKNSADLRIAAESLFDTSIRRENFKYEFAVQRINLEKVLGNSVETEIAGRHVPKEK